MKDWRAASWGPANLQMSKPIASFAGLMLGGVLLLGAAGSGFAQPERLRSVNLGVSQRDERSEHRGGGVILSVAIRQKKVSEKAPHVQLPQKLRLSFQYEPGALSAQYLEGAHALDVEANAGIGNFDPSGRC